ncbi:serine hydrolase domain-containing protein [Pseudotenacibaculum haliotis]|uniref:Serine hydrolase domain-containing protein n=1 Tax=Pseudotenacibaculum haliotis TaxID=1862138 RepID=A0ABW5LNP3_9FLAO
MKSIQYIKIMTVIFLLLGVNMHGQINFKEKHSDKVLYEKALKANAAIENGEYGNIHSLLVVKEGKVVYENYYKGWHKDSLHQAQSVTKSIIATILGTAIQQGIVKSTNDKVVDYYKKYKDVSDGVQEIRIQDLLTQRHGLKWKESPWNSPDNNWRNLINSSGDWYQTILRTEMGEKPGKVFNYSNAAPTLISGAIQNASNLPIETFARKYLFSELGIEKYRFWQGNGGPSNNGMALIFLRSRDLAKIGQLYLQKGKWKGKQIIPEDFAVKATSSVVKAAEDNPLYQEYDYGYFWWKDPVDRKGKKYTIFLARGAGGQLIIVEPKTNVVVVITAWNLTRPNRVQTIFDTFLASVN